MIMLSKGTVYEVQLTCDYDEWWRYNLYIMLVGYDGEGNKVSFGTYTDRVYDMEYSARGRTAPEGYTNDRNSRVVSDPCEYVDVYVYVVTNTFPGSVAIKDSPPFTARLEVRADGRVISSEEHEVNQWGGLTIVGKRYGAEV